MNFLLVVSAILAVAAANGSGKPAENEDLSIFSKLFWSAATTTKKPVAATTIAPTTARPKPVETTAAPRPAAPGAMPANALEMVAAMTQMYPQLQEREDDIFNNPEKNPDKNPLSATPESLPQALKNAIATIAKAIADHPAGQPWDMNARVTVDLPAN